MTTMQQLTRERDELIARLDAIKADYRRGLSADPEEQAIELENAETLAEIERVTRERLSQIEEQLASLPF